MTRDSGSESGIRLVALGVVRRGERGSDAKAGDATASDASTGPEEWLVEREYDAETGDPFYRPLGGGVAFGEHSEDALRREFREELGVDLTAVSAVGTYEDVFTHEGRTHHEVWRIYEAEIVEKWPYERESFTAREPETREEIDCVWKPVGELGEGGETFYPEAVLDDR